VVTTMKDYSNYHEVSLQEKIDHDSRYIVEMALNGYDSFPALINGVSTRILMKSKFNNVDGMGKYIFGRPGEIERGNVVTVDGKDWIVVTLPDDYKSYKKALIYLSNNSIELSGEEKRVFVGNDRLGIPQYKVIKGESTYIPCYLSTTSPTFTDGQPINVPEADLSITIPYTDHEDIKEGVEHTFYGDPYLLIGIDKTKTDGNKGIMILYAKRVVNP